MPESPQSAARRILREIDEGLGELRSLIETGRDGLSLRVRDGLDGEIRQRLEMLIDLRRLLEPGRHRENPVSLGRPDAIARFYAFSFVNRSQVCLQDVETIESRFFGSGVYAIYYQGDDVPCYSPLSGSETPIYLGKAIPADPEAQTPEDQGPAIWSRLREHRKSIERGGLRPEAFTFRYAVIQSSMEGAVEDFLIRLFRPIWNKETKVCHGIGKHGDSAATRRNRRSPWDTMHPGRPWAEATEGDQQSRAEIVATIEQHLQEHPPVPDLQRIIELLVIR